VPNTVVVGGWLLGKEMKDFGAGGKRLKGKRRKLH